jgi:hypothetical protein
VSQQNDELPWWAALLSILAGMLMLFGAVSVAAKIKQYIHDRTGGLL